MLPQAFKEHVERQLAALRAELSRLSKGVDDTRAVVDTKAGLVEVRGHTVCLHHLGIPSLLYTNEHRLGYALWAASVFESYGWSHGSGRQFKPQLYAALLDGSTTAVNLSSSLTRDGADIYTWLAIYRRVAYDKSSGAALCTRLVLDHAKPAGVC